jgi:UTP--glucose-1-phosphate uridylyltransferase
MYAYEFDGTRFDAGDKMGYLKAIIAYGLRHPSLGKQLLAYMKETIAAQ